MGNYIIQKSNAGIILYIIRSDGAYIPVCEDNSDYQQYLIDVETHGEYPVEVLPVPEVGRSMESRLADVEQYLVELVLGA